MFTFRGTIYGGLGWGAYKLNYYTYTVGGVQVYNLEGYDTSYHNNYTKPNEEETPSNSTFVQLSASRTGQGLLSALSDFHKTGYLTNTRLNTVSRASRDLPLPDAENKLTIEFGKLRKAFADGNRLTGFAPVKHLRITKDFQKRESDQVNFFRSLALNMPNLESLNISFCHVSDAEFNALLNNDQNQNLKQLDIMVNDITGRAISTAITPQNLPKLKTLMLGGNDFENDFSRVRTSKAQLCQNLKKLYKDAGSELAVDEPYF